VNVLVIDPISKMESVFAVPKLNTRRTPCSTTPIETPAPVGGESSPDCSASTRSFASTDCRSTAETGARASS